MAGLILKSPYIKAGGAGKYMRYIATRENVERLPDSRPPTQKQSELVQKLTRDFPTSMKSDTYSRYIKSPTRASASAYISSTLEANWDAAQHSDIYMKYIATRPRVEKLGTHGLFSDEDDVDLNAAITEMESVTGNVWTHIISLKREDAERLGYDNASSWRNLLRAHRNDIAEAMRIAPNDFRWYAAFHNEGNHPHVHMMAWSTSGDGYLSRDGIRKIKSELVNDIFRQELLHTYEQKSGMRDELVNEARQSLQNLVSEIRDGLCSCPQIAPMMMELSMELDTVKGKKSYGYLKKNLKDKVDRIVDELESVPAVHECYMRWLDLQDEVDSHYKDARRKRLRLSEQKEFRSVKNVVIQEAERLRMGEMTVEEVPPGPVDECDWREQNYIYTTFLDETVPLDERDEAVEQEKKYAEDGEPTSQYVLGVLYRDGGLLIPDAVKAKDWFTRSAKQGYVPAQYALGKLLLSNDPEVHDRDAGIRWLQTAARNGSPYAAYELGKAYLKSGDKQQAESYFTQAAESENPNAMYMLGKILYDRDPERANHWLRLSAFYDNPYAQRALDQRTSPTIAACVTRLLYHLSRIIRDDTEQASHSPGFGIDRKRRRELSEKRIAMGHKPDDHEDIQMQGFSM